jgi:biofilm PGA synthesis N-glycosyltransferase PgaC
MMIYIFLLSILMILYPIFIYPLILLVLSPFFKKIRQQNIELSIPYVSLVVIVRNGERFIAEKIKNSLALDYPRDRLEIIIASDGSEDETLKIAESLKTEGMKIVGNHEHVGKICMMNKMVPGARGEILIFSDVSALLPENTVRVLAVWFQNPAIGGVCGRKIIMKQENNFGKAQANYGSYEDFIRSWESRIAGVASNEGFLYAMRHKLFKPLPESVTDDLYNAMGIMKQKMRVLYDPDLTAQIPARAKTRGQELSRRRRIVCQSLNGLWHMKELFNPLEYSFYSWILFSHKVLRRMVPVFLTTLFVSNLFLVTTGLKFGLSFFIQVSAYSAAIIHLTQLNFKVVKVEPVVRLISAWSYFCIGNMGTLLGVFDFLTGKKYSKWDSVIK